MTSEIFKKEVKRLLKDKLLVDNLETPKLEIGGDVALPCFFLAKKEKKPPSEIAKRLAKDLLKRNRSKMIKDIRADGPYVNFFADNSILSSYILKVILAEKEKYGSSNIGKRKRVMIEFSNPNPCKAMHIGHARTTFLGDAQSRIMSFVNYDVIRANYFNDVGKQVAKEVLAFKLWGNKKPKKKPDQWLADLYIRLHKEAKKNPALLKEAQNLLYKFEMTDDKALKKIWKRVVSLAITGFKETYKNLGITFDVNIFESEHKARGKELVKRALKKGVAFISDEKTVVVDLKKYGLPSFVILRSDGTGVYYTSDLGVTEYKFKKFKLDKAVWVVGEDQKLYFKQLFKLLELLGYKWAKNCVHMSYGLVTIKHGKMSSRAGTFVTIDDVIDKVTKLAKKEIEKKNPALKNKEKIANDIGIGAFKFAILKAEPNRVVDFDLNEITKFEGNTGPYVQYTHVRACSILKKARKIPNVKLLNFSSFNEKEANIVKKLGDFPLIVKKACEEYKPYLIANYLLDLSSLFNDFYHACKVIGTAEEEKRLCIVKGVQIVIQNGLRLLGIKALENM